MKNETITVKVPATTANLGPGFDCIGMAIDLWNSISITVGKHEEIETKGEGALEMPKDSTNLIYRAAKRLFDHAAIPVPPLIIRSDNSIPIGRGLGSSAAVIVGGILAANQLCGTPFGQRELLDLALNLENHGDNIAAAMLGGCQIVITEDGHLVTAPVHIPESMRLVLFIPHQAMPTYTSRSVLPSMVSREDAVFNLGRTAMLINALSEERWDDLKLSTDDRLHQPYRERLFPPLKVLFRAAMASGALGVFLSGSGSSVLALTCGREMTIGYEMADAADKAGVTGEIQILSPTSIGAQIITTT